MKKKFRISVLGLELILGGVIFGAVTANFKKNSK